MSPRPTDPDTGEPTWDINTSEVEAEARRRAAGLADAEIRKRRRLALELVAELRRPLIEHHAPTDLEQLASRMPIARPRR